MFYTQVTGFVHITTQKDDVKVATIKLEVTGTFSTKVSYRKKTKDGTKSATAVHTETFFSQSIIIEGSEKVLPQGNSKYKFEFSLPEDAKSSLKTVGASVAYSMECIADVPGLLGTTR